ncbi:M23 family metallopeptidase [Salinispira pacifica]|uniref:M23ase beta-sheet core domain-containing protein n=1 Tax=Salinispira pacifica TaxID=1307761 RepID=V5WM55_9SPIO|nr:M23 family metallopeptidase [Salinispira pacifica]AHC16723.1 hypothetical protein L21SP2_3385 [Salinispira pacifica]
MKKQKIYLIISILLAAGFFSAACRGSEEVPPAYRPDDSHAEYIRALDGLNLSNTAMGEEWIRLGTPSENPMPLTLLPEREIRYFDPGVPDSAFYLIEGVRGQQISISVEAPEETGYFLDLFGMPGDYIPNSGEQENWAELDFNQLASGSSEAGSTQAEILTGAAEIQFEPRSSRFYLIRIQPRLLEGGSFTVTFQSSASLSWPVENTGVGDVISVFGDGRDGGRRVHHGIDIIAPRGRPLLTPAEVEVLRVGERDLGGKSVSLRDENRGLLYYYAHLDSYADISSGDTLARGAEIGGNGNTGNALGGPYHLHFGIYDRSWRRPLDPWYFLISPVDQLPELPAPDDYPDFQPGDQVAFSESIELFFQPAGRSALPPSPARRDYEGRRLTEQQKPVQTVPWEGSYTAGPLFVSTLNERHHPGVRFTALRSNAMGFRFPDGKIGWLPLDSLDGRVSSSVAALPEDRSGS